MADIEDYKKRSPSRLVRGLFNEKQIKFLTDNEELINKRFIEMVKSGQLTKESSMEKFEKLRVPYYKNYEEFKKSFEKSYSSNQIKEFYRYYQLEQKAIGTGIEEEKRLRNFIKAYTDKGYEVGNKAINKRLDILKEAFSKHDKVMGDLYDAFGTEFFKFKDFYKLIEMKSNTIESDIIEKLDRVINAFGLTVYDEELQGKKLVNVPDKFRKDFTDEQYDNYLDAMYYIKELGKYNDFADTLYKKVRKMSPKEIKKMNIVSYGDDDVSIHGKIADTYTIKEEVFKLLEGKKIHYNKKGQPYIPGIKKSIVKEWIDTKKKNE